MIISRPYILFFSAVLYTFLFLNADLYINRFLGKYSLLIVPLMLVLFWADMIAKTRKTKRSTTFEVVAIIISLTIFFCFVTPLLFASAFTPGNN